MQKTYTQSIADWPLMYNIQQTLHHKQDEDAFIAAVILGEVQERVFEAMAPDTEDIEQW